MNPPTHLAQPNPPSLLSSYITTINPLSHRPPTTMAPQTHNCILLPNPQHHQQQPQRQQQQLEEEDSLSLSDFPTVNDPTTPSQVGRHHSPQEEEEEEEEEEEFEFLAGGTATQGSMDMCTADEVFLNGQLLPLKASRSEPLERASSCSSLTCSSMSRSHSTDSSASAGSESRRLSISSNFYAHPSPKPGGLSAKKSGSVATRARRRRRSASGLFGIAMAPEIELEDLRVRRRRSSGERKPEKKKVGKLWLLGERFACACRVWEVMEPTTRKKDEEKDGGRGVRSASSSSSSSSCRSSSRTLQCLEDPNSAKDPVA